MATVPYGGDHDAIDCTLGRRRARRRGHPDPLGRVRRLARPLGPFRNRPVSSSRRPMSRRRRASPRRRRPAGHPRRRARSPRSSAPATSPSAPRAATRRPPTSSKASNGTVFTLGDNAYERGTFAEFQECYGPDVGTALDQGPHAAGRRQPRVRDARAPRATSGTSARPPAIPTRAGTPTTPAPGGSTCSTATAPRSAAAGPARRRSAGSARTSPPTHAPASRRCGTTPGSAPASTATTRAWPTSGGRSRTPAPSSSSPATTTRTSGSGRRMRRVGRTRAGSSSSSWAPAGAIPTRSALPCRTAWSARARCSACSDSSCDRTATTSSSAPSPGTTSPTAARGTCH